MNPEGVRAIIGRWIADERLGLKEKKEKRKKREREGVTPATGRDNGHGSAAMVSGRSSPEQVDEELRCTVF